MSTFLDEKGLGEPIASTGCFSGGSESPEPQPDYPFDI
jgi:hypothetical protein